MRTHFLHCDVTGALPLKPIFSNIPHRSYFSSSLSLCPFLLRFIWQNGDLTHSFGPRRRRRSSSLLGVSCPKRPPAVHWRPASFPCLSQHASSQLIYLFFFLDRWSRVSAVDLSVIHAVDWLKMFGKEKDKIKRERKKKKKKEKKNWN